MWALSLWNHELGIFQWGAVISAALGAMMYDVDCRRIPNRLTGPVLAAGAIWAAWLAGPAGVADAACGAVIMALPCFMLFVFAGGGAGDVKIMAALGMWLGTVNGLIAMTAVMVAGVAWGIGLVLARRRLSKLLEWARCLALHPLALMFGRGRPGQYAQRWAPTSGAGTMPYAVAIFTGICLAAGGIGLWNA